MRHYILVPTKAIIMDEKENNDSPRKGEKDEKKKSGRKSKRSGPRTKTSFTKKPKKAVKSGSGGKPSEREIVDEREDPQASDPSPQSAPKPKRAPPTNRPVKSTLSRRVQGPRKELSWRKVALNLEIGESR